MSKATDEDPPDSTDLDGWRRAISDGRHTGYRLEAIVAAIQDLGPCSDKAVLNPLAKHLSDAVLLRRSTTHPAQARQHQPLQPGPRHHRENPRPDY